MLRRLIPLRSTAVVLGLALMASGDAVAQSLNDALGFTYQTNPTLAAFREELRSTNEQVPQALAGMRPTVEAQGSIETLYQDSQPGGSDTINPASVGISVTQPVYRGGRTEADLMSAENTIQATRARLVDTEQTVLLNAVTVYMDVVRAEAVLQLQINNEEVLARQLQATLDRFEVGEVTRTDVSQAEAALSGATATRIQAAGDLRSARAAYEEVIGQAPGTLSNPPPLTILPTSQDDARALALDNNPAVVAAVFDEVAARSTIESIRGELLPEVSVTGSVDYQNEPTTTLDDVSQARIVAEVRVPLYQSGSVSSRVREARYDAEQFRVLVEEQRRNAIESAISAWEDLITTRATIESVRDQIVASEVALDVVQQEAAVGSRTVLDVLDATQELLDAQVDLVEAQRDEVVAQYTLLSAVGMLSARGLGLQVEIYDVDLDYEATRDRFYGTSIVGE